MAPPEMPLSGYGRVQGRVTCGKHPHRKDTRLASAVVLSSSRHAMAATPWPDQRPTLARLARGFVNSCLYMAINT
jgi:hypothetical protein